MSSSPFLLFDLDGTITDSMEGIFRCYNHALKQFGYQPISRDSVLSYIGPPLDETFAVITGRGDKEHIEQLIHSYRIRFGEKGYAENEVYKGIPETLETLHQKGITMGICTSKRGDFAEKILQLFDLHHYFSFVSGGDIGIKKATQIKQLLDDGKIPQTTIMVGDREVDITSAHSNGIQGAGVLWGYGSEEELTAVSPEYLLSRPGQLVSLIK